MDDCITSKMRRLSNNVDQEIMKAIEHEMMSVVEENRRKIQSNSHMFVQSRSNIHGPNSTTTSPSHPEQNIFEKSHRTDWFLWLNLFP